MDKIDFVLTWVDGEDEAWQSERARYDQSGENPGNKAAHYRDYGTLRYWFRLVERYAPWVNRIHFVTCGQKPEWLKEDHPRLHLVNHADFMFPENLPTFSINPIELQLHKIEGLAERFVYFNDDTFLCAPTKPSDFFKRGLPCDSLICSSLIPSVKGEVITYILFNDLLLLNANLSKRRLIKKNLKKYLSPKYGKGVLRNLYHLPVGKFGGFVNPHLPNSFLKSTFSEVWEREGEALSQVCANRFRTREDVNQYLMRYWQLATGRFSPRSPRVGKCFVLGPDNAAIEKAVMSHRMKLLCINDNPNAEGIEEEMQWLNALFEALCPEKCSFEK
ncbi:MAG: Stealth CR1 domain-containing protein [Clostridia bacterium]|nr:Stealth CR1 domain-containing protein [Clostridia bacterium]